MSEGQEDDIVSMINGGGLAQGMTVHRAELINAIT